MTRLLSLILLTVTTLGQAADTVIYYGPDGSIMQPGKYWEVRVTFQNGQPVMTQRIIFEVTGTPIPPPPPPVTDVVAKIKLLFSVVTDADKSATSSKLAKGYGATIGFAEAGTIVDASALKAIQQQVDKALLANLKKTSEWQPWTEGMTALVAPMDLAATLAAYKIAQAQLGGVPVPPPPPTPSTAVKALILLESETQSPQQAQLLTALRNDKAWSKKVELIDPQAKNEKGQPDPLAQAAVKAVGSQSLPRLLLLDAAGSFVGVEPMPGTWAELKTVLTAKGVKP